MSHLLIDERSIPTGEKAPVPSCGVKLGDRAYDDEFALLDPRALFSLSGNGRCITIEFVEAYPYVQMLEPREKDYIAIEPMTDPINALVSGRGLRLVKPGSQFRAAFRVNVHEIP